MEVDNFIRKIRKCAVASFLIPLIAINSCLIFYKFLGNLYTDNVNIYPNLNWDKKENTYTWEKWFTSFNNSESHTLTNCPKYNFSISLTLVDNKVLQITEKNSHLMFDLEVNNKIKSVSTKMNKKLEKTCVKNNQSLYSLLKKFNWIEKIIVNAKIKNSSGFAKIKNPYLYGEVSISRTARYFPMTFIFKPLIILSALFLFFYWKNNLNLFSKLRNKNILPKFSKSFFYLGFLSCIFLILHAIFLGLDFDSKLFDKTRRLIIILFIFCELFAQFFLTKNLFKFKEELKKYISPLILKTKIIFVSIVFFVTFVSFTILAFGDPSSAFKHILEWNYFSFLLVYYSLSRLLWKLDKNPVHTPEGA